VNVQLGITRATKKTLATGEITANQSMADNPARLVEILDFARALE
jgi:hypothetical protein